MLFQLQRAPETVPRVTQRAPINVTSATMVIPSTKAPRPPLIPGVIVSYEYFSHRPTQWLPDLYTDATRVCMGRISSEPQSSMIAEWIN